MKRLISVVLLILVAVGIFAATSEARFSNNDRSAVVLEAFYALRPSHDGSCDKTINGNCVSNWNYINNDWSAYYTVKNFSVYYPCYSSDWAFSWETCYAGHADASFYYDVSAYGYGTFGGSYGQIGRGGQCKYFANLILYRSGSDQGAFPNYSTMLQNVQSDMTQAVEGDIIFTYGLGITNHVAIVVEIKKDVNGNVTGLDVIDANYITDTGGSDREVIGRHLFNISYLQQYYYIWTDTSYYGEQYIP